MEQTIYPGDLVVIAGNKNSGKTIKLQSYIADLQNSGFICRPLNLNRLVLLKNTVYFLDDIHKHASPSPELLNELYRLAKQEQVIILVTIQTDNKDTGIKNVAAIYGERGPNGLPLFTETTYNSDIIDKQGDYYH